jgi:hypothetical protein
MGKESTRMRSSFAQSEKKSKWLWPESISDFDFTEEELKYVQDLIPLSEIDPPLFISWDIYNLESFIFKMSAYQGSLIAPFDIPNSLTTNNVALAIVNSWRFGIAGIEASIRAMCVPCTMIRFSLLIRNLGIQSGDIWWTDVDGDDDTSFPLARVFILRPESSTGDLDVLCDFP